MDILEMMDGKSQKNFEKLMSGELDNSKPIRKHKKEKKPTQSESEKRLKHFSEYHFKTTIELLDHIKRGKKVYRGGEVGWITIDSKDPNMVVSYQRQDDGKMGFSYERIEVFKAYLATLEKNKIDGYVDFWHKKPFEKKEKSEK